MNTHCLPRTVMTSPRHNSSEFQWVVYELEYFMNGPTLLKSTRKVDESGIRTCIFGLPDGCSTNWAIESTGNSMLVLSSLSAREILITISRSISARIRCAAVSTLFQNHPQGNIIYELDRQHILKVWYCILTELNARRISEAANVKKFCMFTTLAWWIPAARLNKKRKLHRL